MTGDNRITYSCSAEGVGAPGEAPDLGGGAPNLWPLAEPNLNAVRWHLQPRLAWALL